MRAEASKPRVRINTAGEITASPEAMAAVLSYGQRRDAARHDLAELNGWAPGLGFAGADFYGERDTITGRARDMDANNGWINGGLDRRVESVIGVQIRLSAQPQHELLNRDYAWRMKWTADTQARFKVWANDIHHRNDAKMQLTFGAQAKLAYLTYARDGEALAEIRDNHRGISNPTNVLLISPERLSTPDGRIESQTLRNGIEFDENGAAVAYHIRSGHPNDPTPRAEPVRWTRIPARGSTGRAKIVHVFSPRLIEQNRGLSRLAEIILPAKMIDRVDRAEVQAALKSALLSIFIKSPGTTDDLEQALAPGGDDDSLDPWIDAYLSFRKQTPVRMEGHQVGHLLPGEDVVTPESTHPNSNYPNFIKFLLQKVAGSLGVSYAQISQDWAGINYSSARALLNEMWRSFLEDRWFFTQHFLTPIYAAWLEWEVANADIKVPGGPVNFYKNKTAICMAEWIGPGRGSVDPLKEANADNLDTAAGRKSTVETILERGRDPSDVLSEEVWYRTERAGRGLPEVNHDIKSNDAGGGDAGGGATEEDHDGDGKPLEQQKRKDQAQ